MKRWIQHAIIGAAFAGCVPQDATQLETSEQATCPGPNNYVNVDPLKAVKFTGTLKTVAPWQQLVTTPDPNVSGQSIVAIVDTVYGTIPWAATFATSDLKWVHSAGPDKPWLDIVRVPPVPPPIGSRWFASYLLETSLVVKQAPDVGAGNVTWIKPTE